MNKANQEVESEHVPIMNQLFKFYNKNASSIRGILVADCPWVDHQAKAGLATTEQNTENSQPSFGESSDGSSSRSTGNPISGQIRRDDIETAFDGNLFVFNCILFFI